MGFDVVRSLDEECELWGAQSAGMTRQLAEVVRRFGIGGGL